MSAFRSTLAHSSRSLPCSASFESWQKQNSESTKIVAEPERVFVHFDWRAYHRLYLNADLRQKRENAKQSPLLTRRCRHNDRQKLICDVHLICGLRPKLSRPKWMCDLQRGFSKRLRFPRTLSRHLIHTSCKSYCHTAALGNTNQYFWFLGGRYI